VVDVIVVLTRCRLTVLLTTSRVDRQRTFSSVTNNSVRFIHLPRDLSTVRSQSSPVVYTLKQSFSLCRLKPRPHQQQCRSNVQLCRRTFDFVAKNGNDVKRVYRKISSFRQSRNKLNMFNLFRLCRKDEISSGIVAEMMSKQHSTLSKEKNRSTCSSRRCCWCGRDLR